MNGFAEALSYAKLYDQLGLQALPSRMDCKRPCLTEYAQYRKERIPDSVYAEESWQTTNIQLMTGSNNCGDLKVTVVDLDSQEAISKWRRMCESKGLDTRNLWACTTGSGGIHVYFRLPPGVQQSSRMIWGLYDPWLADGKGDWLKHHEIRILADSSLSVAPPSVHVETGQKYYWRGRYSPLVNSNLAEAPDWLLGMQQVQRHTRLVVEPRKEPRPLRGFTTGLDFDQVREAISPEDKLALAISWGLRVSGEPYPGDTGPRVACHSIEREDRSASCIFYLASGDLRDFRSADRQTMSFWNMAVRLRAFASVSDAVSWCAERYTPYLLAASVHRSGSS